MRASLPPICFSHASKTDLLLFVTPAEPSLTFFNVSPSCLVATVSDISIVCWICAGVFKGTEGDATGEAVDAGDFFEALGNGLMGTD